MLQDIPREELDRILFESLRAIYRFEMTKERLFGISFMDIFLLQYLRTHSPCCMGDVAAEMSRPISTVTRVVDRLEAKYLIGRRKDPSDRRNVLVELKPRGLSIVKEVEDHTCAVIMKNLERLGQDGTESYIKTAAAMPEILKTPERGDSHERSER
jgi:DNA-binding MarR family transcriptional regulator